MHPKELKKTETIDSDYELWMLLARTREVIHAVRDKELLDYIDTPRQAYVLNAISTIGEKATPGKIARYIHRARSSTTQILNRMEQINLIKRSRDLDRKDLIRIRMTDKGFKIHDLALKRKSIHEMMSCLSEEERQQLTSILNKLLDKAEILSTTVYTRG